MKRKVKLSQVMALEADGARVTRRPAPEQPKPPPAAKIPETQPVQAPPGMDAFQSGVEALRKAIEEMSSGASNLTNEAAIAAIEKVANELRMDIRATAAALGQMGRAIAEKKPEPLTGQTARITITERDQYGGIVSAEIELL